MAHLVVLGFDSKQKPEQVFDLPAALAAVFYARPIRHRPTG